MQSLFRSLFYWRLYTSLFQSLFCLRKIIFLSWFCPFLSLMQRDLFFCYYCSLLPWSFLVYQFQTRFTAFVDFSRGLCKSFFEIASYMRQFYDEFSFPCCSFLSWYAHFFEFMSRFLYFSISHLPY